MRHLLVHVTAETNRHAGHADIIREMIDSSAGLRETAANLPSQDEGWWVNYVETLERAAREADRDPAAG